MGSIPGYNHNSVKTVHDTLNLDKNDAVRQTGDPFSLGGDQADAWVQNRDILGLTDRKLQKGDSEGLDFSGGDGTGETENLPLPVCVEDIADLNIDLGRLAEESLSQDDGVAMGEEGKKQRHQTGKPITLDVGMRDTVLIIKRKIQNKEGISVGQQVLFYLGEELDNGRTIASYNIEGGSTIYAVFRLGDTMLISVTTEKNRTFSLKVKRWFTVLNVKFLIESMVGIPIGKRKLWLDKVELENDMTLADLHFSRTTDIEFEK
ncbi:hypothetical protein IFM89_010208 [Coptis chinensis]|uniref:Ubiquitin-like domain-containing protein n=1 Tax=Coptis chinensis TaxID=261450 RepID=A0A835GW30_9MAGN|nr:hypothetical protein IFM89_010208 [Coptis chinensis]